MTQSRFLYVFVGTGLCIHSFFAYEITGILPGYAGSFYWFTIPHLVLLPLSLAAVIADFRLEGRLAFRGALICLGCALPTFLFAMNQWPGGDDGPGMAWAFVVGPASLVNALVGIPALYFAHRSRRAARRQG
jgi:hypothetical protein